MPQEGKEVNPKWLEKDGKEKNLAVTESTR